MKVQNLAAGLLLAALPFVAYPVMAANYPVQGHVDGVTTTSSGAVLLTGWACNRGWTWGSNQVDVYAGATAGNGGTKLGVWWADQPSEPAVSQICETTGVPHRFYITLTISMRQQHAGKLLYVYGFALPGSGNNVLLNGSGQHAVPAAPAVNDSTYYIHSDRLGSNVVMTDTNARVVARTEYTAYGAAVQNTSKNETPGYTGHYEDPLTGLTYMQARYYDADLGRFISIDPVGAMPGDVFNFARYAYANNSPMMFTDPTGMVAAACTSSATMLPDGSWSVTGGGCTGGGGSGGVAGWFPGWGSGSSGGWLGPGGGGGGGAGGRPVTNYAPVTSVANRPPDTPTFLGFTRRERAFASMFDNQLGGWNRFMNYLHDNDFNISIGFGAASQVMPDYADAEIGIAIDTSYTFCTYRSVSGGVGVGGVWGTAGLAGGLGTGALASGSQTSYGAYWQGGEGAAGEGKVSHVSGGGHSFARGIVGASASATGASLSAGTFVSHTIYRCL
jgi:RHS repeat-associated protein